MTCRRRSPGPSRFFLGQTLDEAAASSAYRPALRAETGPMTGPGCTVNWTAAPEAAVRIAGKTLSGSADRFRTDWRGPRSHARWHNGRASLRTIDLPERHRAVSPGAGRLSRRGLSGPPGAEGRARRPARRPRPAGRWDATQWPGRGLRRHRRARRAGRKRQTNRAEWGGAGRPLPAAPANRGRRYGHRLDGPADRAGPAPGGPQADQAGDGHAPGGGAVRGGAAGAGADGPPPHRPGP